MYHALMSTMPNRSSRVSRTLSTFSVLSLLVIVACKAKVGGAADAAVGTEGLATEAVSAAPPPVPAPLAANEDDVSRFPDEKPLANVAATLQRATNLRAIPGVGRVVTSLPKGATVTEIARRGTSFMVLIDNPSDQRKLMGWVGQEAFTAAPTGGATTLKAPTCKAPEVPLMNESPFCGRVCTSDAGCSAGQVCKGAANTFTKAKLGDAVALCTVFTPTLRPVTPVAAGAARVGSSPTSVASNAGSAAAAPSGSGAPSASVSPTEPSSAPAATGPTSNLPECEDRGGKRPKPGSPPPPPCQTLPRHNRPNGMQCQTVIRCRSQRCVAGVCAACNSEADCEKFPNGVVCQEGRCLEKRLTCLPQGNFCGASQGDSTKTGLSCCSGFTCRRSESDPSSTECLPPP